MGLNRLDPLASTLDCSKLAAFDTRRLRVELVLAGGANAGLLGGGLRVAVTDMAVSVVGAGGERLAEVRAREEEGGEGERSGGDG